MLRILLLSAVLLLLISTRQTSAVREPLHSLVNLHNKSTLRPPVGATKPWTLVQRDESVAKPEIWPIYWQKGLKYYRAWKTKSGQDKSALLSIEEHFDIYIVRAITPNEEDEEGEQKVLKEVRLNADWRNYRTVAASYPKGAHQDDWTAGIRSRIDAKAGVVIVDHVQREGSDLPDNFKLSQLAWALWVKACQASNSVSHLTVPGQSQTNTDYSGITTILSFWIVNGYTQPLFNYIVRDKDPGVYTFHPDDLDNPDPENPFWVLIGNPLGSQLIHLLTENKQQMKGKGIKAIWVDFQKEEPDKEHCLEGGNFFTMGASIG